LQQDIANWQRRILNGYWIIVLLSFLAEAIALIVLTDKVPNGIHAFLIHTILIPTSIQLSLVLANEFLERKYNKPRPYTIIFTGILLFAVLIYGNKLVIGIQYVMLVPMLVATFHFNRKYLKFAYWSV